MGTDAVAGSNNIKEELGWESTVDLEQGLRMTIPYFEELLRKGL